MRRLGALLALSAALAGCGSGPSGEDFLRDAWASIGRIRSGTVHARLRVRPPVGDAESFGFAVDGPFRFGDRPTASVRYVRIANGRRDSAKLVLAEGRGYVERDGRREPLPASRLDDVRRTISAVRVAPTILDVSGWVESSHGVDCPASDAPVNCVGGKLDSVATIEGLAGLAQLVGTSGLAGADSETLRKAVRKATFFVMAGKDDHLLRDLRVEVELARDVPESLERALGNLAGAKVSFELAVDRPAE